VLLQIKQWESIYIRDFDIVKNGELSELQLYTKLTAMYYDYVSTNGIEPFSISFGRGKGFCINANSHVGVMVYDDVVLYIMSMIPNLTLGKILYLQAQAEDVESASATRKVLSSYLDDEETVAAVDYFVISLLNTIESIKQNGMITEMCSTETISNRIVGKLNLQEQIKKNPAYDKFCVEKTIVSADIPINQVLKAAISKSKEVSSLEWVLPLLSNAEQYFDGISTIEEIDGNSFPRVADFTSIRRDDYEKALLFAKYILFGYDPLDGDSAAFFPEFMLDMNEVFEFYVTVGLKRIFKEGFEIKKRFTLGVGPNDIPIERKNIELDGYYNSGNKSVVLDTKNKYRSVLDRDIPDFIAANPDIYQQYYYASRVNSPHIILVYPSNRKRTAPIGKYQLNFPGNKNVDLYFWALHITGTPKENKRALVNLAQFIEAL